MFLIIGVLAVAGIAFFALSGGTETTISSNAQKAPYVKKATADKARAAKAKTKYLKSAAYKRYAASA